MSNLATTNWKAKSIIDNAPGTGVTSQVQIARAGTLVPHSVTRLLSDKLGETPSLLDFGCLPDGTDQTVAINYALQYCANNGIPSVLIPDSYTFSFVGPLVMQSNVTLYGQGPGSKLNWLGSPTAGQGCIDVPVGTQNWQLDNFAFEGNVTTPTQFNVAGLTSNGDPMQFSTGTFIWIHGGTGSQNGKVTRLNINHVGAYAILIDGSAGSLMDILIDSNLITNSRPVIFGVPGDYSYGSWVGGIFWVTDGVNYNITNLTISNNEIYWCIGNCIWGHAYGSGGVISLLNQNVQVVNNTGSDTGLDWVEMCAVNNGVVSGNKVSRVGYVSLTDNTPGTPRWINTSAGYEVEGVAYDTTGLVINCNYTNNVADAVNGGFINLDGYAQGTVGNNTGTSSWYSADPNAQASLCGPATGTYIPTQGENWSGGIVTDNSNNNAAGSYVNTTGNTLVGFGGGAIEYFAGRYGSIQGNTIVHPNNAYVVPIVLGNITSTLGTVSVTNGSTTVNWSSGNQFGSWGSQYVTINNVVLEVASSTATTLTLSVPYAGSTGTAAYSYAGPNQRAYNNVVNGNMIYWAPSGGGSAIAENSQYSGFWPTDTNLVQNNTIVPVSAATYQFLKDPNSSSTSGPLRLSSVSPNAAPVTEAVWQTEGTAGSSWQHKLYKNAAGVGTQEMSFIDTGVGAPIALVGTGLQGSGVIATGNRSSASIEDIIATFLGYFDGSAIFFNTAPSYSPTTKQNAMAGTSSLAAAGLRYNPSANRFEVALSVSSGAPVWTPLMTGSPTSVYLPIDPRYYGAAANGTTDDSGPISLAIANGGLFLQAGLVYGFTWSGISSAVGAISNNGWCAFGGGTLRLLSGSTHALTLTGTVKRRFDGVIIDGNGQCGSNATISLTGGSDIDLMNMLILGTTSGQYALSVASVLRVNLLNVDVSQASPNGLVTGGTTTYNALFCRGIQDNLGGW